MINFHALTLKRVFLILVKFVFFVLILIVFTATLIRLVNIPSNDRDWAVDQQVLPYAEFSDNQVTIKNIRNFSYSSVSDYTPDYYDKTFNLDELVSVDFIVEPLKPVAVAHTFVSFGFGNGEYIAVSVEIRKEIGEEYSPLKGILDQYELMYVIADEKDVLKLRTLHRDDVLHLYPAIVTKEKTRELFVSMLDRVNNLKDNPEFYNTITSTCTTNISDHVNEITPGKVPWDLRLLLPLDSDEYAYELGLIQNDISFEELREKSIINYYVEKYKNDPEFSSKIRDHLKI